MKISLRDILKTSWGQFKINYKFLLPFFFFVLVASLALTILSGDHFLSLSNLVAMLLYPILYYSVTKVSLKTIRGEKIEFKNIFEGLDQKTYISFLGVSVSITLAMFALGALIALISFAVPFIGPIIGILIFILLFLYFIGVMFFPYYRLIDVRGKFTDALKYSFGLAKGNRLFLVKFLIFILLLNIAGVIVLAVGLLVTIPISSLAMAHVYEKIKLRVN